MGCACSSYWSEPRSYDEVVDRCAVASRIGASLVKIGENSDEWLAVHECTVCRRLWSEERPFSEQHGGGPACYYPVPGSDPDAWLSSGEPIAHVLRARPVPGPLPLAPSI